MKSIQMMPLRPKFFENFLTIFISKIMYIFSQIIMISKGENYRLIDKNREISTASRPFLLASR